MSFRIGRLRFPDLLLLLLGAALCILMFASGWFVDSAAGPGRTSQSAWSGMQFLRWPLLLVCLLAVLAVPASLIRSSQASAIASEVFLAATSPVAFAGLLARLAGASAVTGSGGQSASPAAWAGLAVLGGIVVTAWWAVRSQSRGFDPDPTPDPIRIDLASKRPHG